MSLPTRWTWAAIGIEGAPLRLSGVSVWENEWEALDVPSVELPHPTYPHQLHSFQIYRIVSPMGEVVFAATDVSACVWAFYVPDSS